LSSSAAAATMCSAASESGILCSARGIVRIFRSYT
jgi:hypothetical protein